MAAPVTAPGPGHTSDVAPSALLRVRPALAAAVVSGALVALQQRLNGELGHALGDPLLAALVSFGIGLVLVAGAVLARSPARRALGLVGRTSWPQRLGGLGGATLVAVGATAAPRIGVALLTVGLVAGQTGGGVLVDRAGLGPGGPRPLSAARLGGALLCLVAVGLSALDGGGRAEPLLLAVVVAAGFLVALQQALNGVVRETTGDASVATLVNFVVGTGALLLGVLVQASAGGLAAAHWPGPDQWYLYLGGPLGAGFVTMAAVVVKSLGVLRLSLAVVAGQLLGACVLDAVAPAAGTSLALATVAAALLTLVAVAVSGRGPRS